MDWSKWQTVAAIKDTGGAIEKIDEIMATAINAASETTKDIGTEIKVAGVGLGISTFSPQIASTLGLFGFVTDETQIDTIGQALILGAGAIAANKFVDNFTKKKEESKKRRSNKADKIKAIEAELVDED
jgi:hypothetical protein